jgi:hypothetical protein
MKLYLLVSLFLLALSSRGSGQDVNLIIQVNEELVHSEISDLHIKIEGDTNQSKIYVSYVPGRLMLNADAWSRLNSDTSRNFTLYFTFTTYRRGRQESVNFYVAMTRRHLNTSYLILNIYDFRSRKYRSWYQYRTKNEFLAELRFENSGIIPRQR